MEYSYDYHIEAYGDIEPEAMELGPNFFCYFLIYENGEIEEDNSLQKIDDVYCILDRNIWRQIE